MKAQFLIHNEAIANNVGVAIRNNWRSMKQQGEVFKRKNIMGDWGDWRCKKCGQAYCQDCKSPIHMDTLTCAAYEESKQDELTISV